MFRLLEEYVCTVYTPPPWPLYIYLLYELTHNNMVQVRKFFMVSLSFHLVFTMLHTAFVLQVYSSQCILKAGSKRGGMQGFLLGGGGDKG